MAADADHLSAWTGAAIDEECRSAYGAYRSAKVARYEEYSLFAVLAVIGLAVEYWYVSVGVLVVAALAGWLYWRQQQELQPASDRLRLSGQICGDWSNASKKLPRGAARYEKLASHDPAKS